MDVERLLLKSAVVILSRPRAGKMKPDERIRIGSIERQALLKICHRIVPLPQIELGACFALKGIRIVGLSASRCAEIFESAGILAEFQIDVAPLVESGRGCERMNSSVQGGEPLFIVAFGAV